MLAALAPVNYAVHPLFFVHVSFSFAGVGAWCRDKITGIFHTLKVNTIKGHEGAYPIIFVSYLYNHWKTSLVIYRQYAYLSSVSCLHALRAVVRPGARFL